MPVLMKLLAIRLGYQKTIAKSLVMSLLKRPANNWLSRGMARSYRPFAISFSASRDKLTSGMRCALSRFA
jgi:hypothetical protein